MALKKPEGKEALLKARVLRSQYKSARVGCSLPHFLQLIFPSLSLSISLSLSHSLSLSLCLNPQVGLRGEKVGSASA
jgi:hypothetical protein